MTGLILIEIIAFIAVFYKLVTTNHWTVGKKLMVALSAGIFMETMGLIIGASFGLPLVALPLFKIPKVIVGLTMCYYFYRNGFNG
jgi:hypothetical protein